MTKDSQVEQVAVVTPRPTRWDMLLIGVLWAAVILAGVYQCSISTNEKHIPQIIVTVTPNGGGANG